MNDRGLPVACEVDIGNAISMYALRYATGEQTACLDWNDNYGCDPNRCILFHCGSTAQLLMKAKGEVIDHSMLHHDPHVGPNCSFGCNVGRIRAFQFGFARMATRDVELEFYLGEMEFTGDPIPEEFFECASVARIQNLQQFYLGATANYHGRQQLKNYTSLDDTEEGFLAFHNDLERLARKVGPFSNALATRQYPATVCPLLFHLFTCLRQKSSRVPFSV